MGTAFAKLLHYTQLSDYYLTAVFELAMSFNLADD